VNEVCAAEGYTLLKGRGMSNRHSIVGLCAASLLASATPATAIDACRQPDWVTSTGQSVRAIDGATILLADGRSARLAGIVAPNALDGDDEAVERSRAALDVAIAGRVFLIHGRKDEKDRHGRMIAHVVAGQQWVQAELLRGGHVRAAFGNESAGCANALLRAEAEARKARRGLWAEARFAIAEARDLEPLRSMTGRFAIIEGTVEHVGEAGGRIYLDFGRRYTRDFTVVIPREAQAAFAQAGVDLRGLSGKAVRVRGVIYAWGGPAMELRVPAALELLAADEG
jgi:endonuclease YncB( thermonuclease family)